MNLFCFQNANLFESPSGNLEENGERALHAWTHQLMRIEYEMDGVLVRSCRDAYFSLPYANSILRIIINATMKSCDAENMAHRESAQTKFSENPN